MTALVQCDKCQGINRLGAFKIGKAAICGRCGAALAEPLHIRALRAVSSTKAAWAISALAAVLIATQPFSGLVPKPKPLVDFSTRTSAPPAIAVPPTAPPARATPPPTPQGVQVTSAIVLRPKKLPTRGAPFAITTADGSAGYLLKLVDSNTGREVVALLVPAGGRYEFKVPLGTYRLRYATGPSWIDEQYLFGPDTSFSEADTPMAFSETGDGYLGHEVRLVLQRNGNLRTRRITPNNF